jgi:hypothetical protein
LSLITLIKYLPYIIELINAINKRIKEDQLEKKVSDDLKLITEAFNEKDPNKLNAVFGELPKS